MACISNSSVVQRASQFRFQWEGAQQCFVLLFPEGMVQLNESAGIILERCADAVAVNDLVAALQRDFPDAEDLADDVMAFLEDAHEQGWIIVS